MIYKLKNPHLIDSPEINEVPTKELRQVDESSARIPGTRLATGCALLFAIDGIN